MPAPRAPKAPRAPGDPRPPKEPRDLSNPDTLRDPRDPRDRRSPRVPSVLGDFGAPEDSADPFPQDLARNLAASTGLPPLTVVRVIADVVSYFSETAEEFVQRRHAELQRRQYKNEEIWPLIAAELSQRRFPAPALSERQLRRIVYT